MELGLTFCPSQKNLNKEQLTLDFYHFIHRLKLKKYFHFNPPHKNQDNPENHVTTDDDRSNLNWSNKNSDWYPDSVKNDCSEGLLKFINNVTKDLKDHLKNNENKFWNNLDNDQRKALLDLANDPSITIKPADKGGSIVIMNTDDYVKSCLNSLSDSNFYEELPTDPNPKCRTDLDQTIDDLLSSNIINEFEASNLQCGSRTPYFYGLPKIHKKFDRFPPLSPICSGFNSCTSNPSEFVDAFLKPLAQLSPSYIKDTSDFVQKIETDVAPLVTHSKTFLVTMDVSSFYPNIDHQEGIDGCETALNTRTSQSVPTSVLCDLIMTILKCNTLKFGERFFHQIKGTAMGTPMAVNLANLFMGKFETDLLNDYRNKYNKPPGIWLRYIDDIFSLGIMMNQA